MPCRQKTIEVVSTQFFLAWTGFRDPNEAQISLYGGWGLLRSPKSSLSTTPKQAIAAFNLSFVSRTRALIVKDQFP